MQRSRGFTLVELLLSITLVAVMSVVVGRLLFQGYQQVLTAEKVSHTDWRSLVALDGVVNDVHQLAYLTRIAAIGFIGVTQSGQTVLYRLRNDQFERNNQPVADGVTGLQFDYLDAMGQATSVAHQVRYVKLTLDLQPGGVLVSTLAGLHAS